MIVNKILIAITVSTLIHLAVQADPICQNLFSIRLDPKLEKLADSISMAEANLPKIESGIFARILRGKKTSDFNVLSTDPGREIVILMDNVGIETTFGNKGQSVTPLERIGYTRQYIEELHSQGIIFKVALFRQNGQVLPATWNNLGFYLNRVYQKNPIVIELFKRYLPELQKFSFQDLLANSRYNEVIKNATSKNLTSESSLWEFRSFLYNELRLTELYSGDGFTRTPDGRIGVKEYFFFNKKLNELDGHIVAEIPI